jgi:hypothetical protein
VVEHPSQLTHALELNLTPTSSNRRRPQRVNQGLRLRLERAFGVRHRPDLCGQRPIGLDARELDIVQRPFDLLQCQAHRVHEVGDRLLARLEVRRRMVPQERERSLRLTQKRLVVPAEGLGRQGRKRVAESRVGLLQKSDTFRRRPALQFQARRELDDPLVALMDGRQPMRSCQQPTDGGANEQARESPD